MLLVLPLLLLLVACPHLIDNCLQHTHYTFATLAFDLQIWVTAAFLFLSLIVIGFALTFRQFIHYHLKFFIYYSIVQQALILNIFMYVSFYIAFNILLLLFAVHKKLHFKSRVLVFCFSHKLISPIFVLIESVPNIYKDFEFRSVLCALDFPRRSCFSFFWHRNNK